MIVKEDDRRGAAARRGAKHFARMDDAGVERADGDDRGTQHAMLGVEQQDAELLDWLRAELGHQEQGRVVGRQNLGALAARADERAPAGFDRRHQLSGAGAADAGQAAQLVGRAAREAVHAADRREDGIGQLEGTGVRTAVAQDDGEQFVVAQAAGAEAIQFFARAIVRRNCLHRPISLLLYFFAVRRLLAIGLLLLVSAGCSGPPQKEIDQAQSALDLARTAGAERYASSEFAAAASSLEKAHAAVGQRDYRQALNYALDSRQRATEAARQASDGRARAKAAVEALYGQVATLTNQLQAALRTAETAAPAKLLRAGQATLRGARTDLQKASAAMSAGNYADATKLLTEVRGKLDAALTDVRNIPPKPVRKRPR